MFAKPVNSTTTALALLLLLGALSGCAPTAVVGPQAVETTRQPRIEAKADALAVKADRPEWKVGYEWQYSWKDHSGNGTLTKEIIREEPFAGVPAFVLK